MPDDAEGSVAFETVVHVLRLMAQTGGFTVAVSGTTVTLVKDGNPQVVPMTNPVGRRMLLKLAHTYCDGRPEFFFHPEWLGDGGTQRN